MKNFLLRIPVTLFGIILTCTGAILNAAVSLANYGYMPVVVNNQYHLESTDQWFRADGHAHLLWLADRFKIGQDVYSLGDFVMLTGAAIALLSLTFYVVSRYQVRASNAS